MDPCSSKACHADISSILTPDAEEPEIIKIQLCADQTTTRLGAIWEINFSRSNDSSKLEVFFVEEARQRFRTLQDIPDFNTQLSFVSIVGGRGVGKSIVASLLSGNASMFTVSEFSIGKNEVGIFFRENAIPHTFYINFFLLLNLDWEWDNWHHYYWS